MTIGTSDAVTDVSVDEYKEHQHEEHQEDHSQLVSFRLANEEYGMDIMHVQEIIMIGSLTQMPQVPDYVRGLINLRGHVIPIFDLRIRFGLVVEKTSEHSRIIVLNVGDKTIGIIVDAVNEVLRLTRDQIEPAPEGVGRVSHEFLSGLVKLEGRILLMLNIEQINSEESDPETVRVVEREAVGGPKR